MNWDPWEFRKLVQGDLKPPFFPERHWGSVMEGIDGKHYKATAVGVWTKVPDTTPLTEGPAGTWLHDAKARTRDALDFAGEVVMDCVGKKYEKRVDFVWKLTAAPKAVKALEAPK